MEISITIKNVFTRLVEMDTVRTIADASMEAVDALHRQYEMAYPNSHVNFVWGEEGNKSFICGAPYNMMQDEIAHSEGRMTWDEYFSKWYNVK